MFLGNNNNNNNDIIEGWNPFKRLKQVKEIKRRAAAAALAARIKAAKVALAKKIREEKEKRDAAKRARVAIAKNASKSCPALNNKIKMGFRNGAQSIKEIKNVPNAAACRMHTIDEGGKAFIYRNNKHPVENFKKTCVVLKNYPTSGNFIGRNDHSSGCANWMKDPYKGCK